MDEPAAFRFPAGMTMDEAGRLLAEAYGSLDEGKLLRATFKAQRAAGIDPPTDVQYVAAPRVETDPDGLGVSLNADILIYDEFPEMDQCITLFEQVLGDMLVDRLEREIRRWEKARGR